MAGKGSQYETELWKPVASCNFPSPTDREPPFAERGLFVSPFGENRGTIMVWSLQISDAELLSGDPAFAADLHTPSRSRHRFV